MKFRQNHIIKTQDIEIEFRDRRQDMGLPNDMADLVRTRLNVTLEETFNELLPNGNLVIDELNIDLGFLPTHNWEKEFVDKAVAKIKQAILEQKPAYTVSSYENSNEKQGSAGSHSPISNNAIDELNTQNFSKIISELKHFLEYGYFKWRFASVSLKAFEELFMEAAVEKNQNLLYEIYDVLLTQSNALVRFLNQFSFRFIELILIPLESKIKANNLEIFKSEFPPVLLEKLESIHLLWIAVQQEKMPSINFPLAEVKNNLTKAIKAILLNHSVSIAKSRIQEEIMDVIFRDRAGDKLVPKIDTIKEQKIVTEKKENLKREKISDALFISNAGLILLHPYFLMFFKELDLVNDEYQWKNADAANKAVLITQYLVDGLETIDEQFLILNKILCGVPFETPMEKELNLTDNDKYLCNELLTAVIKNWSALKSTSKEGLQNTFLKREGQLIFNDEKWILTVEQKAWDILLGQLPWGIGFIKTPWMKNLMQVNWG